MVEDDPTQRERVRSWLEQQQWLVSEAENGRVALARLKDEQPDVILLDLLLRRDMNGWEFLDLVKANPQLRNIPVIAMSGAELTPELRRQCKAEAFLAKPLHPQVLLVALEQYRALPS